MTEPAPNGSSLNHTVFISVGSNMGDKYKSCHAGVRALTGSAEISLMARSHVYKTEPVGYKDQDWFINLVIQVKTSLDPFALLERIGDIQRAAGRKADAVRFGPRILDMDIIFFDDLIMDTENLVIPHPRMHSRRFVLQPLCDIDPNQVHPVLNQTVGDLLENLDTTKQEIIRRDD